MKHGVWKDWAQWFIWDKWQKTVIDFTFYDDLYFEDFCREVVHIRKKKQFKEVERKYKEEIVKEEERRKKTVVSKAPLRRLRSEIPALENMKKRSNSIMMKVPALKDNSPVK